MSKGFYSYLAMLVAVTFLTGASIKGRIDGDTSFSLFGIAMFILWCAGLVYLVIYEYKLKETYKNVQ